MSEQTRKNRCRLILVIHPVDGADGLLRGALAGGDVASVILARGDAEDGRYQSFCELLVPVIQQAGAAGLICDDTRLLGRTGADGVLLTRIPDDFKELVTRLSPQKIVGCGGLKDRHRTMEVAERNPDFVFFGRPDGDIRPEPHPKNLALAEWWSHLAEIPCVIMGGSDIASAAECARSGAEFVALGLAVFSATGGPQAAVAGANRMLDELALIADEI